MRLRDLMDHLQRKRKGQQSGSGVYISVDPSRPEGHDEWRSAVKKLYQVLSQGRTDHVVETSRLQKRDKTFKYLMIMKMLQSTSGRNGKSAIVAGRF